MPKEFNLNQVKKAVRTLITESLTGVGAEIVKIRCVYAQPPNTSQWGVDIKDNGERLVEMAALIDGAFSEDVAFVALEKRYGTFAATLKINLTTFEVAPEETL